MNKNWRVSTRAHLKHFTQPFLTRLLPSYVLQQIQEQEEKQVLSRQESEQLSEVEQLKALNLMLNKENENLLESKKYMLEAMEQNQELTLENQNLKEALEETKESQVDNILRIKTLESQAMELNKKMLGYQNVNKSFRKSKKEKANFKK